MTSLDIFAEQSALPNPALFLPPSDLETAVAREGVALKIDTLNASELTKAQQQQIRNLVRSSLNETLRADYFEQIAQKNAIVYCTGNLDAIGIAYTTPFGTYLDILATNPKMQKRGLGSAVFDRVSAEGGPALFLRSQPFRKFRYGKRIDHMESFENCDGIRYNGYFKGMSHEPDRITGATQWMQAKPSNYEPRQTVLQNARNLAYGLRDKVTYLARSAADYVKPSLRPY